MKELLYPFDSSYIMKRRRSIKKELLNDNKQRIKKNIAVLGGSTTNDIVSITELFLLNHGIEPSFYQSEYGRYWQDAIFLNPELDEFGPDFIYIHTSLRNLTNYNFSMTLSPAEIDAALENEFTRFVQMWETLEQRYHCPIIQNNFEMPFYRLLGNSDASDIHGKINFITRLNLKFYEYAQTHASFYINDINYMSASYGLEKWSAPIYWYMYKYALCIEAIPELSCNIANIIKSLIGKNKKALALDLDNTLWGGVIGDDGQDGIEIGQETPMAQAFSEFQDYIKAHKQLGVLLTVCSKNDHENAIIGLEHRDSRLKPDDFVNIKANWNSKDMNIADIAAELNILTDSFVFVDDNPAEREIVSAQLPDTAAVNIGNVEDYIRRIDGNGFFELTVFSDDDIKRNDMYIANAQRTQQMKRFENYEDYLLSLDMNATIADFPSIYISRITQLTNKSNQFNLTTKRYTEEQMRQLAQDDGYIRLCGKLTDKFGDNGIVSVVIGKKEGVSLHIDLWLMSCRVLKRDMELAMLDMLAEKCREFGISEIIGYYFKSPKNSMVSKLYESFGFECISDNGSDTVWRLNIGDYTNKNSVIKITNNF